MVEQELKALAPGLILRDRCFCNAGCCFVFALVTLVVMSLPKVRTLIGRVVLPFELKLCSYE